MQDKATAVSNTPSIDPVIWLEDALYKWGLWRSPGSTGASSLGYAMPAWAESAGLPASKSSRPERGAAHDQLMSTLDRAISNPAILTEAQRRCVIGRYSSMPSVPATSLAASLGLSPRTVREHLKNALDKLLVEVANSQQTAWLRALLPAAPAGERKGSRQ